MTKNQRTYLWIVIGIVVIGGLVWIGRPSSPSNSPPTASAQPTNALAADSSTFDFGSISMAAGTVSHAFTLTNRNEEEVTVERLYTSCMCTTASLVIGNPSTPNRSSLRSDGTGQAGTGRKRLGPYGMPGHGFTPKINEVIAPDETATIEVVFDPAAHGPAGVGPVERIVYLETPQGAQELTIRALVTP